MQTYSKRAFKVYVGTVMQIGHYLVRLQQYDNTQNQQCGGPICSSAISAVWQASRGNNSFTPRLYAQRYKSDVDTSDSYWLSILTDLLQYTHLPAKLRMPKQFDGCSCRIRNLQQASRTELICSRLEAGSSTCEHTHASSDIYWLYLCTSENLQ